LRDYKGAEPFILVGYFSTSNICFLDFVFLFCFLGVNKGAEPPYSSVLFCYNLYAVFIL